jgi:hypothetical protein
MGASPWQLQGPDAFYNAGNVGIGTLTPSAPLEVRGTGTVIALTDANSGNQENEHAIVFGRAKILEGNFGPTESTSYSAGFKFITHDFLGGANFVSKESVVIEAKGNVGIGTSSPAVRLEMENTSIDGDVLRLQDSDGTCDFNPEAGPVTVSCSSDIRLKTDIRDAQPVLDELMQFRVRDYTVIASGTEHTGVIAQEVQAFLPDLIREGPDGFLQVAQVNPWKLVKALQELKAETDAQQQHITALEARLTALEQVVGAHAAPTRLTFSSLSAGWPLFGGLLLLGLFLGQRWRVGGRRHKA